MGFSTFSVNIWLGFVDLSFFLKLCSPEMLCFAESDSDRIAQLALVALAELILGGMASPFGVPSITCIVCGSVPHQDTELSATSFPWREKYIDETLEASFQIGH